jgi:hypothetical protein
VFGLGVAGRNATLFLLYHSYDKKSIFANISLYVSKKIFIM